MRKSEIRETIETRWDYISCKDAVQFFKEIDPRVKEEDVEEVWKDIFWWDDPED